MEEQTTIQITFADQDTALNVHDLGEYLQKFSELYNAATSAAEEIPVELVLLDKFKYVSAAIEVLSNKTDHLNIHNGSPNDKFTLACSKISYTSPLG